MDGDCGSVSMADYWNTVATPFFFIVLGFCLFVLFQLSDIKLVSAEVVDQMAASLRRPRLTQPGARAPVVGNVGRNVGSARNAVARLQQPPPLPVRRAPRAGEAPRQQPGRIGEAADFGVVRPPPPPALLAHAAPNNGRNAATVFAGPPPP